MVRPRHSPLVSLLLLAGCASGTSGSPDGFGGPVVPPPGLNTFQRQAGLDAVAPGPGVLRIDFTPPPGDEHEIAVYVSPMRSGLFATPPLVPAEGEQSLMVEGLSDGVEHFVGLGIRPIGGGDYSPIGPVLRAAPGSPLYVDPMAPSGGDGQTPATAYNDVFTAVLNAFVALLGDPHRVVNLWLVAGDYPINFTLPVASGVAIHGGFGADFDLATRDPEAQPSILRIAPGQKGLETANPVGNSLPVVLDGLIITGDGRGNIGIETNSTNPCSVELRSVLVTNMADRGIRVRNVLDQNFDFIVTNSQSSGNGADGLNGTGAYDYIIYNSIFSSNVQEGIDLNQLTPETGGTATLNARSCQFFGNGAEGVDCTLTTPLFPTFGAYSVQLVGCTFERNAFSGCLIDGDFELSPGYSADILVRECTSRGNAGYGFHLDLDAPIDPSQHMSAFLYRVLATSNGLDGIYASSESRPSLLEISGSALVGNNGAAIRAEGPVGSPGNCSVVATHCLLVSNFGGGVITRDVPAGVCSSIAYDQPAVFDPRTVVSSNVVSEDYAALAFLNAPEQYARVMNLAGNVLTLASATSFPTASLLELANDGIQRTALSVAGTQVTLEEAPDDFGAPGLLSVFGPTAPGVIEDYRLGAGSIAAAAGLHGLDAGPFGSPAAGIPGLTDPVPLELFHPRLVTPALSVPIGADEPLVIDFSKPLDGASANGASVIARRGAGTLDISLLTSGATLTVLPPGGGWGAGDFLLELDGLLAEDGTPLSGAVALPVRH